MFYCERVPFHVIVLEVLASYLYSRKKLLQRLVPFIKVELALKVLLGVRPALVHVHLNKGLQLQRVKLVRNAKEPWYSFRLILCVRCEHDVKLRLIRNK